MNETSQSLKGPGRPRDTEVRRRILDSAAQLLEQRCYDEISVDAIAEQSGAGKATIYRWWPNKAAVLIEAFRERISRELPFPDTGDFRQDARQQLQNFTEIIYWGRRGKVFRAFIAGAQADPEVAKAFREIWIRPRRAEARKLFERWIAAGVAEPSLDPDLAVEMLFSPLYYRLLTGWGEITPEYLDRLVDMTLGGYLIRK
ncbi:MAG TPA: TetR/AcrR family transcriptional regulator [Bryobacteraceae bacterium]|nr:TetR/AcrR family transcriptional regulator [Bryobacteraceae bacterium]